MAADVLSKELSESRASALRNVQQLVSQRLDIVRAGETAAENSRQRSCWNAQRTR